MQDDPRRLSLPRRWVAGTLGPADKARYLTQTESAFLEQKRAQGVPLAAVAQMLGRAEEDLRRGSVVEDFADPNSAALRREMADHEEAQQRREARWRRAVGSPETKLHPAEASRRTRRTDRTWHAPGAQPKR